MSGKRNFENYENYASTPISYYSRPRSLGPSNMGPDPHTMELSVPEYSQRIVPRKVNNEGAVALVNPTQGSQGPVFTVNRCVYEGAEGCRITNETFEYRMANDGVAEQQFTSSMRALFMMSPYPRSKKEESRANISYVPEEDEDYY